MTKSALSIWIEGRGKETGRTTSGFVSQGHAAGQARVDVGGETGGMLERLRLPRSEDDGCRDGSGG